MCKNLIMQGNTNLVIKMQKKKKHSGKAFGGQFTVCNFSAYT